MSEKNNLRQQAEIIAKKKHARTWINPADLSPEEIQKMVHELQVHQIELEMQNEELRVAHEKLNASQERYFDLFDLAPVGYLSLNEEGQILEANFTAAELMGMGKDALAKEQLPRFIHPNDQDIYYHHRKALFETGKPQTCDMRMVRADGTLFWAILNAAPAQNPDGTMACRIMIIENTERKRMEKKLKLAVKNWDNTFDAIQDGVTLLDADQRILRCNSAFQNLFQKTKKEIIGKHCYHLIHGSDGPVPGCPFIRMKSSKKRETMELEIDGRRYEVLVDPILDENEDITSAVHIVKDITERKQIETALRQSEEKLRNLAGNLSNTMLYQITAEADGGRRFTFVSGNAEKMNEVTAAELLADASVLYRQVLPEYLPEVREREEKALKNLTIMNIEVQSRLPSGRLRWFEYTSTPRLEPNGLLVWDGVEVDITERKNMETALRASEERYRGLIDLAVDGILLASHEGIITEANQQMSTITGMAQENFIGKHLSALPFSQDSLQKKPFRFDLLQKGETVINERTLVRPDGSEVWVEMRSKMMPDGDYQLIFRDITERKMTDDVLRQFMASVYNSSDAIGMSTPEGKHYYQNAAFDSLFGDVGTDPPATLYVDKAIGREVFKTIMAGERWAGEVAMYAKDRRVLNILLRAYANKDDDGRIIGLSGIHTDLTERRALENRLSQVQKMESVGRLAGGVAHDFNNMLGVILGFVELALDKLDPSDPLNDDLMEIRKAAQRSADLTAQLLAFARKQPVAPRPLDLNTIITGMLTMLQRRIGADILLTWHSENDLWKVNMDPSQIEQTLSNLCDNSREAITGKGGVTIRTENAALDEAYCANYPGLIPGEYVLLSVTDTGCGMSPKTLNKVFEPFFTTKEVGKGSGLGLSTTYGIIKQNNGFIYPLSEPGQGSTFKIFLPRHKQEAEEALRETPSLSAMGGNETILLVEDEPAVLKVTRMMLSHLGYTVVVANTPDAAHRLAEKQPGGIDLLITDVVMPEINGRDLAQKLMTRYPNLKTLFMSGYTADIITNGNVLEEGVHFIQKPFLIKALAAKIREALGDHNE